MATPPFLPDESKPGDNDIVSQYPAVERTFRDIIEDWLLIDHDTDGEHAQVTLPERGSDPTNATDTGFVYTKDDGGDTELFYEDDAGNVVQITEDGGPGPGIVAFPASTSMLFYQDAAPTGWTKDVAGTLDNHALRVVTSTAWAGGSNGATAFTSVFGAGKATASHVLSIAEMPSHDHQSISSSVNVAGGSAQRSAKSSGNSGGVTGGGGGHLHDLSLDLNYISLIRATKD